MPVPSPAGEIIRFGVFQFDLNGLQLYKAGVRIKLQEQPFRVLAVLVQRAGEVVTREELRQRIWPTDVYGTFDQGLNNAIRKVRDALGDSADNPRFVETVAKHGYRFIAPVSKESRPPTLPRSGHEKPQKITLIGLSILVLLALVGWSVWRRAARVTPLPEKVVLAVLPFDNLNRDPEQDFFSDGLTEEMIAQLGKLNPARLTVISRGSVAKYKGSSLPPKQIGHELHADYLLQGSVRRAADRVRITVQLIQVQDQTDRWAETYDRELKDILSLQDSVTQAIANQIRITLTPEQETQLTSPRSLDPEAYESYLKGRYYWNKRNADALQKATTYFEHAVGRDPRYGAAYSGLADCNSGLAWHGFKSPTEALTKADTAALKAIEIDPESGEAHASLGLVRLHRWEWSVAEAEFKRAIELNPYYANAHHWFGDYLSVRGRHDEALLEAQQALKLDPLNLMINTWVGLRYYLARKYDRAIEQGRNAVDLDANFAAGHLLLGESYIQVGRQNEALVELQRAAKLSGDSPLYVAQVGVAQAKAGNKKEALEIIEQLQKTSAERYVSPYGMAQIYAALDDKEQTLKWLETAYDGHAVWMSYLAVDPLFDAFHADARFQELLRRLKLKS
jgi:TolB-like protein/DNA-binding winged helix-turn-helix (wHTH) protein/Flp pilus assembly protein TadD